MKRQKEKKIANSKGFSFIEAMLAVAVMITGIMAAMQLFTAGIRQSMESRDQTIGAMLAQEGAEIVQNIRDNNWAARTTRLAFDDAYFPLTDMDNCRVYYKSSALTAECNNSSKNLFLDVSNYYVLDSGTPTKFQRKLFIRYQDDAGGTVIKASAKRAEITSVVIWGSSFPSYPVSQSNCSTISNCSYSKTILSKWAE